MDWKKILDLAQEAAKFAESDTAQNLIALGGPQAAAIGRGLKLTGQLVDVVADHAKDEVAVLGAANLAALQDAQARIWAKGDSVDAAIAAEGA